MSWPRSGRNGGSPVAKTIVTKAWIPDRTSRFDRDPSQNWAQLRAGRHNAAISRKLFPWVLLKSLQKPTANSSVGLGAETLTVWGYRSRYIGAVDHGQDADIACDLGGRAPGALRGRWRRSGGSRTRPSVPPSLVSGGSVESRGRRIAERSTRAGSVPPPRHPLGTLSAPPRCRLGTVRRGAVGPDRSVLMKLVMACGCEPPPLPRGAVLRFRSRAVPLGARTGRRPRRSPRPAGRRRAGPPTIRWSDAGRPRRSVGERYKPRSVGEMSAIW